MYKVVIADDEDLIRRGLCEFIPWEKLGFEIAASYENGTQVIDHIRAHHVDLILTDIKMIDMSGLDVAKYVYENNPEIAVCLISGYRDFEYARKAMKYNVRHYLTKPTVIEEVTEAVNDIRAELDERNESETTDALRSKFFSDIFMGNYKNCADIIGKAEKLGLNNSSGAPAIFRITIENFPEYLASEWEHGKELLFTAVSNFIMDNFPQTEVRNIMINNNEMLFVALFGSQYPFDSLGKTITTHLTSAKESIRYMMKLDISFAVSHIFRNIEDFASAIASRLWFGDIAAPDSAENHIQLLEMYKSILLMLFLGNKEQLGDQLDNIAGIFSGSDAETVKKYLGELFDIIFAKIENINSRDFRVMYSAALADIFSAQETKVMMKKTSALILDISDKVNAKESASDQIVRKAKDYIEKNYATNISLDDVANYVFLNSSYLSRLFKQYTGENFRDYLINIRITKAIGLMRSGQNNVNEISEMCGYKSPKYFAQQFKHVTGLTPTEYINRKG